MHVVVVLRLVPDLTGEIEIAEDGRSIDREWIDMKLNEFDDHALEEALVLKEKAGATVTAIAFEADGADRMLQTALARGADKALKIRNDADAAPRSRQAAPAVAAMAQKLGADLVLTGVQTPEDVFGQLVPFVGAVLNWPHLSAVCSVRAEDSAIVAQQELSGGVTTTLRIVGPAVLGVQAASRPIRYVSGSKLRQAAAEKIETHDAEAAAEAVGAEISSLAVPLRTAGAEMLGEDPKVVASKIHALLVERGLMKDNRP